MPGCVAVYAGACHAGIACTLAIPGPALMQCSASGRRTPPARAARNPECLASNACADVLSDPESRRLYDIHGDAGMRGRPGAAGGTGNASAAWDEFQPFVKANKNTRARDASGAAAAAAAPAAAPAASGTSPSGSAGALEGGGGDAAAEGAAGVSDPQDARQPCPGDLVEYVLADWVKAQLQDGRERGVGLLIARNQDRADARRLPEEQADLCEVEPLRQEDSGSSRCDWRLRRRGWCGSGMACMAASRCPAGEGGALWLLLGRVIASGSGCVEEVGLSALAF
jgi:hypothetical protein